MSRLADLTWLLISVAILIATVLLCVLIVYGIATR